MEGRPALAQRAAGLFLFIGDDSRPAANLAPPSRDSMPTTITSGELPEIGQKTSAPAHRSWRRALFRVRGLQDRGNRSRALDRSLDPRASATVARHRSAGCPRRSAALGGVRAVKNATSASFEDRGDGSLIKRSRWACGHFLYTAYPPARTVTSQAVGHAPL